MNDRWTFWRGSEPLVLASNSRARRDLLLGAGLFIDIQPASINERQVETAALMRGASPSDVARQLAREKGCDVSKRFPGRFILSADQTLDFDGTTFHKPNDRNAAFAQLCALTGRRHQLHSAYCIIRDGIVRAEGLGTARLSMRSLSNRALEYYLTVAGDQALQSPGGYQIEHAGIHLFESIEGDHSTILGLPMRQVLASLRELGLLVF